MDILFMIDGFTTSYTFAKQKDFVKRLAQSLDVAAGRSRAAGLTYGSVPMAFHSFSNISNLQSFENSVKKARLANGQLRIDRALVLAKKMFTAARPSVPKVLIMLTAGKQSPFSGSLEQVIQPIRNSGIQTYVISIGDKPDLKALTGALTNKNDIISVTSSSLLDRQIARIKNKLLSGWFKVKITLLITN